jgi:hypothetical protein
MKTNATLLILLTGVTGVVAERPKATGDVSRATALVADSASICWERFSRGVALAAGCTSIGVTTRVDTVRDTLGLPASRVEFRPFAFGPVAMYRGPNSAEGFTAGQSYADPRGLIALLARLRSNRQSAFLALTGGDHAQYITAGRFDFAKWKAGVERYTTPVLKTALQEAVTDGTVLGYVMLDEPQHVSWGGALTKATVDSMAAYCRELLPSIPCGVAADHRWRAHERYRVVDFVMAQTWMETGSATAFRDSAVAMARRDGVALVLSINLFGAKPSPGCEPRRNQCLMRPAEVREWGRVLVSEPYACALMMWRYDAAMWGRPEYQTQFQDIATIAKQRVAKECRR